MLRPLLVLCAVTTLPFQAAAQQAPGGMPPGMGAPGAMPQISPEVQAKFTELQTIGDRLKAVRDQAAKSKKLAKAMDAFRTDVETRMVKANPALKPKVERFHVLEKQLEPLAAAKDFEKAQPLLMELRGLANELAAAQQKMLESKDLADRGKVIQDNLRAEMERIEPKMPQLVARAEALRMELQKSLGGPMGAGPAAGPRSPGPRAPGKR